MLRPFFSGPEFRLKRINLCPSLPFGAFPTHPTPRPVLPERTVDSRGVSELGVGGVVGGHRRARF